MSAADSSLPRRIAVAGNPNCGKSTLFNALTGLFQKVANFPGCTVEQRSGTLRGDPSILLIDLPGAYSLSACAPDEEIPRDMLLGRRGATPPEGVLIVLDAAHLERNLYLASQVLDLQIPALVVCNMLDRADAAGMPVDVDALAGELGVPVAATVGHRGQGVAPLCAALRNGQWTPPPPRRWRLPEAFESVVAELAGELVAGGHAPPGSADGAALLFLTDGADPQQREREPLRLPPGLRGKIDVALGRLRAIGVDDAAAAIIDARYQWIGAIAERVVSRRAAAMQRVARSDRIDRWLTAGLSGGVFFAAVVLCMFAAIFWLAEPLMGLIEAGQTYLQGFVRDTLPAGAVRDLLADGVVGGAGSVVVFLPQICLLFLFVAVMEDSGYMARAAFLMHRLMSRVGLPGKSFIPLLSSFACAIPGIMATRVIDNRRDRFATILIAPLMSCSARLPVYLTMIAVVFAGRVWLQTLVIFGMYALGVIVGLLVARLLKSTLLRGPHTPFIMELPPYSLPRSGAVLRTVWERGALFLTGAGTTIFGLCIVLWGLAYFPRDRAAHDWVRAERTAMVEGLRLAAGDAAWLADEPPADLPAALHARWRDLGREAAARQLEHSALGRVGRAVAPVFEPLGFDWKIGIAVLASFAAREVFVGTMGTLYSATHDGAEGDTLRERMRADRWPDGARAGRPIYDVATGLSVMVFFVLCCQCMSTLAVARRETGSWGWPALMFIYMTGLAYVGACGTYQVVSRFAAS